MDLTSSALSLPAAPCSSRWESWQRWQRAYTTEGPRAANRAAIPVERAANTVAGTAGQSGPAVPACSAGLPSTSALPAGGAVAAALFPRSEFQLIGLVLLLLLLLLTLLPLLVLLLLPPLGLKHARLGRKLRVLVLLALPLGLLEALLPLVGLLVLGHSSSPPSLLGGHVLKALSLEHVRALPRASSITRASFEPSLGRFPRRIPSPEARGLTGQSPCRGVCSRARAPGSMPAARARGHRLVFAVFRPLIGRNVRDICPWLERATVAYRSPVSSQQ